MKRIIGLVLSIIALGGLAVPAYAAYTCPQGSVRAGEEVKSPAECTQPKEKREVGGVVADIVNVVLSMLGIIAVIVIIIGGFMYATSSGDASKVTRAKNVIMYAVIGLVVSLLAWAIVNFVVMNLAGF